MLDHTECNIGRLIAPNARARRDLVASLPIPVAWGLTASEGRVVRYLAAGLTPAGIANTLGRSVLTIRTHLKRAIAKAGVNTQVALVARMYTVSSLNLAAHLPNLIGARAPSDGSITPRSGTNTQYGGRARAPHGL
jgi:DNA-binding CsgD family transcriptional regulator